MKHNLFSIYTGIPRRSPLYDCESALHLADKLIARWHLLGKFELLEISSIDSWITMWTPLASTEDPRASLKLDQSRINDLDYLDEIAGAVWDIKQQRRAMNSVG